MHCPKGEQSSSTLERFSLDLGDCIGVESSVDLRSDLSVLEQEIISDSENQGHISSRDINSGRMKMTMTEKEYPPPIPWLARTENLPSHMPWVMRRYHTDDGRLIIREEKVKRHEYFQAHRSNGRLTLRLICNVDNDNNDEDEEEERNGNVHDDEEDGEVNGSVDDVAAAEITTTENQTLEEDGEQSNPNPSSESCMEKCGGSGGGSGGECYKSVRRNSGIFEMTLPTFRPVHT